MSPWHRLLAGVVLVASAAGAFADDLAFEPGESPLQCLVTPATKPQYPTDPAQSKQGVVVRVRLTFTEPQEPPRVDVLFGGQGAFVDQVLDYVHSYRLPCLKAGAAPVVALQEFQFVPGEPRKVLYGVARDDEWPKDSIVKCLTGAGVGDLPQFPAAAMAHGAQGTVFARFTFKDAASAPEVEIVYDGGEPSFGRTIRANVSNYRLPCMPAGASPIHGVRTFFFSLSPGDRTKLKDATFASFAGLVAHLEQQHVRFDFTTMSCPFEIKFTLRRPYLPNLVGEFAERDPNRREFIEWLKQVELNLSAQQLQHVMGYSMTITVPCSILDLT